MGEDSQTFPLAHYQAHHDHKTDEELAAMKALKKERTNKCFIYVFAALVLLSVVVLIFALIVLRVNSPNLEISAVSVGRLSYENRNSSAPSFNLTLVAELAVDNSNFGPFDFESGAVFVAYGGVIIGERNTSGGRVGAKGKKRMNVSVEARSKNGVLDVGNVRNDLNLGLLKLRSFAKLRGRVRLIQIFRKRTKAEMNCSLILNLKTRKVQEVACE